MKAFFIGTAACVPGAGEEVASFLINDNILVDTGWCNVLKLKDYGLAPEKIEYLILTHLHQDHYLGLPQFLFYLGIGQLTGSYKQNKPLTIIGPSEKLLYILKKTEEFLQLDHYPELIVKINPYILVPGKNYEDDKILLETIPAKHHSGGRMEDALICKLTDKTESRTLCFTGDTSYHPPIADFVRGMPVLIHDSCHTSATDAANIAKTANVGKLYLIHHPSADNDKKLREAKEVFSNSFISESGKSIEV
ncbi:MAG: MBL fold metallo-hydrolase [bacterium]|nr:MBL fold metallo-hydrolase [bacterium]